jgi:hypothetical protein
VKFKYSVEGNLALNPVQNPVTGEAALLIDKSQNDVFQSYTEWELAVYEAPKGATVSEYVIPVDDFQWDVTNAPVVFTNPQLPFDVTVTKYFRNCAVYPKGPMFEGDGPVIDGYVVVKQAPEKEAEQNFAGLYATFTDKKSGKKTESILWGAARKRFPLTVVADGQAWLVTLRKRRFPLPFSIRLDQFTYETHPGTMQPSVYLSDVTKIEGGREQSLKITMNEPLRHEGYTLYQSGFGPDGVPPGQPHYSVFAVVKNPSDQWPKWSCYVIALGLLWHFGSKLIRFIRSQRPVQPISVANGPAPGVKTDAGREKSAQAVRTHA